MLHYLNNSNHNLLLLQTMLLLPQEVSLPIFLSSYYPTCLFSFCQSVIKTHPNHALNSFHSHAHSHLLIQTHTHLFKLFAIHSHVLFQLFLSPIIVVDILYCTVHYYSLLLFLILLYCTLLQYVHYRVSFVLVCSRCFSVVFLLFSWLFFLVSSASVHYTTSHNTTKSHHIITLPTYIRSSLKNSDNTQSQTQPVTKPNPYPALTLT